MCGLKDVKSRPKLHWAWQKAVNNTCWNRQRAHQQGLRAPLVLLSCSGGLWARRETISTLEHLCWEAATLIDCLSCSADRDELIPMQGSPTRTNQRSKQKHEHTNTLTSLECVCVYTVYVDVDSSTPYPKLASHLFIVCLLKGMTTTTAWKLSSDADLLIEDISTWNCLKINTWRTYIFPALFASASRRLPRQPCRWAVWVWMHQSDLIAGN